MSLWLHRYGWLLVIPMGVFGCLAALRYEWLIVGLIVLLIVYPFVLAMFYFNYALKPETREFIRPLKVRIDENGIRLLFYRKENEEESGADSGGNTNGTDESNGTNEVVAGATESKYVPVGESFYTFSDISSARLENKGLTVVFKSPKYASIAVSENDWNDNLEVFKRNELLARLFSENGIKIAKS